MVIVLYDMVSTDVLRQQGRGNIRMELDGLCCQAITRRKSTVPCLFPIFIP